MHVTNTGKVVGWQGAVTIEAKVPKGWLPTRTAAHRSRPKTLVAHGRISIRALALFKVFRSTLWPRRSRVDQELSADYSALNICSRFFINGESRHAMGAESTYDGHFNRRSTVSGEYQATSGTTLRVMQPEKNWAQYVFFSLSVLASGFKD